jgi:ParB/RepB/Spo0J family partition protein
MTTSVHEAAPRALRLAEIREPEAQHRERIDPERLGALADSMGAEGQHQPIGVREPGDDGLYEIIFGHRRFLAARSLRWPTIEAKVYPRDANVLLIRASENLQREQLNPVEEAHVVELYLEAGHSRAETARLCRRSTTWVDQRVALLALPADLLDAIREHGLALAVAHQLADVDHEPYRRQLTYEAVQHGATAASAALWRQHYLSDRDRIVHNAVQIEQIIADREKFRLMYPCDWCDAPTPYEGTRTVRLCVSCDAQLQQAKAQATEQ